MGPDINALADSLVVELKGSVDALAQVKGWNLNGVQALIKCAPVVIKSVEVLGKAKDLTGAEKKALAIELLLRLVKLPWWLPQSFVREALSVLIDTVVSALKEKFNG